MERVTIQQKSRTYDVKLEYHSDFMCQNYDAEVYCVQESDGRITIRPDGNPIAVGFVFEHSDPDRVIAVARMMQAFAEMVKYENDRNHIDISDKA